MYAELSTILVLEPDVIVRSEISEFLRQCGYKVFEGVSAQDFHAAIGAGTPIDILLSEVRLDGGVSGFELAHSVRQTMPQIDVILVSGVENVVEKADKLCERGPVKKPYHPDEILRRIRALERNRRQPGKAASGG